jgi:hypothetical protein
MSSETMVLTRKIQLLVDSSDKEFVHDCFQKLYNWQYACFRAANYIFTHQYVQEQLKDLFYLTEETKVKLADIQKDKDGILTTSRHNTTYQVLSKHFKGEAPMDMFASLNHQLVAYYNKERAAYWKGEKSVRNYKRNIPIPFAGNVLKALTDNGKHFSFKLFKIPFKTYLGKDFYDKRLLLKKLTEGTVKLCSSSLVLKKNKIFMLAAFQVQKEKIKTGETVMAEASLSIEYPISIRINKYQYSIGTKDEFLYRRLAIQSARQRVQKNAAYNRGGKGRKRKLKSMEHFHEMEKNYVNSRMHLYSRRLIDICQKHQVTDLLLVNQQESEAMAKEDAFLLRNWSYFNLKDKITYKAARVGINVIIE